jgi:uncharacterized protein YfdQ (DUF2303 family)
MTDPTATGGTPLQGAAEFQELEAAGAESDVGAAITAVTSLAEVEDVDLTIKSDEVARLIVVPRGKTLIDLEPYADKYRLEPRRRKGSATLTTLQSLIEHANRFKDEDSAIYLDDTDQTHPRFVSVLNYHRKADAAPRFGDHRGVYAFPLSEEWVSWTSKDEKEMNQAAFAAFLEDRIPDVIAPGTAFEKTQKFATAAGIVFAAQQRLLELSKGLSIKVDQQVTQHVNLQTGESQLIYKEEHTTDGPTAIKVPNGFCIQVPVVKNGPSYQIPVRLRYRISNQRPVWTYKLYRTDLIFEDMINDAVKRVADETQLPVYRGKPES